MADAVLVGAGAGLSASAGLSYSGERFTRYFRDFHKKYGIADMYEGGFYPFATQEEYWAWWSRQILINRYDVPTGKLYLDLLELLRGRNYFVLTTNVDHQFQLAGFDKERLFYTQGDYGLWQCAKACHANTCNNEEAVRRMVLQQRNMRVPSDLLPRCPACGGPMTMNLRRDGFFVQDEGWHAAQHRYDAFLRSQKHRKILLLELGVGFNTPGIVKYPFWLMAAQNPHASYACLNMDATPFPRELNKRALRLKGDLGATLAVLLAM